MKKGLILAIMMVVAVGLALPVYAEAPIITTLPVVIIGNAEAADQGDSIDWLQVGDTVPWNISKSVLRFLSDPTEAGPYINLVDLVDWRNETYAESTYRFYWSSAADTSGIKLTVGQSWGGVTELTLAQLDALSSPALANYGAAPPDTADILREDNQQMSILNITAMTLRTGTGVNDEEWVGYIPQVDQDLDNDIPTTIPAQSNVITPHTNIHRYTDPSAPINNNPPLGTVLFGAALINTHGLDFNPSATSDTGMNFNASWTRGYAADPAQALYQEDMDDMPTVLTLIAAVTSGTGMVNPSAPATMDVYSLLGADAIASNYVLDQWGEMDSKWNQSLPIPPTSTFIMGGSRFSTAGVGFEIRNTDNPAGLVMFASWNLGTDGTASVFPISGTEVDMAGKIYSAELRLRSDSPSADLCPGYRCEYANEAFTHYGGIEVTTNDAANAPYLMNDFTAVIMWEVPHDCNDMGDAGTLADWPLAEVGTNADKRQYGLIFDQFHSQYGDYGVMTLEQVRVEAIMKPTAPTASATYTGLTDWIAAEIAMTYFGTGSIAKTATAITIQAGTYNAANNARFIGAFAPLSAAAGDLAGNLAAMNNKVVHLMVDASSVNADTTPVTRLYLTPYMSIPVGNWDDPDFQIVRNIAFFDMYGALAQFCKFPPAWGGRNAAVSNQPNPGVPMAAGSTLDMWIYTHQGYDEGNDYFLPQVQVMSSNLYPPPTAAGAWPDDAGGIVFSNVTIEQY
jgi:hypothetical protein